MARVTLNPTRLTYVDQNNPTTYHGNLSTVRCGENYYLPIAQFTLPANALAGTITNVSFSYFIEQYVSEVPYPYAVLGNGYDLYPYVGSDTTSAITYIDYDRGANKKGSKQRFTTPGWAVDNPAFRAFTRTSDVTSIVANNLTNGVIGFIIQESQNYGASNQFKVSNVQLVVDYEVPAVMDPSIIYPNNVYIRERTPVSLSWVYNANGSATLKRSEVGYRVSGGSWTTVTVSAPNTNYSIGEGFSQGTYEWRVRITDSNDSTSNYVTASFTVVGKPAAPVVTNIVNSALTTITWNANDQFAYKLSLEKDGTVIDSAEGADDRRSYKPNLYLDNGTYSFRISISNAQGEWSTESIKVFTINATAPAKGSIGLRMDDHKVVLTLSKPGTIMRNGEVLAVADGTEYIDETCVSDIEYAYQLRVCSGAGYADSDKAYAVVKYEGFIIQGNAGKVHCNVSDQTFLALSKSFNQNKQLLDYVGRELPVVEVGEQSRVTLTRTVIVTAEELEILTKLYKESKVFYRDTEGNGFYATITSLNATKWRDVGYSVQVKINRVHIDEVIVNA